MADLLSTQDYIDIFSAYGDLYDTFFKYVATFVVRERSLTPFNQNREDMGVEETPVRCLVVFDSDGEDGQTTVLPKGEYDDGEGYFLFAVRDLEPLGFSDVTRNTININASTTTIKWNGVEYDVIGVEPLGPLNGEQVLAKFHFKKPFSKGDDSS